MGIKLPKPLTIIRWHRSLQNYPIKHIDLPTQKLLLYLLPPKDEKGNRGRSISFLDAYLGLIGQRLGFLDLSLNVTNETLNGFVGALLSEDFLGMSKVARYQYAANWRRVLHSLSSDYSSIKPEHSDVAAKLLWKSASKSPLAVEYYQGWRLKGKEGKYNNFINLASFWNKFGPDATRKVFTGLQEYAQTKVAKSQGNFTSLINDFLLFIDELSCSFDPENFKDSDFVSELVERYCRQYFEIRVESSCCLETTIKRWNDARPAFQAAFFDSGVFGSLWRPFPFVPPRRKSGAETRVKRSAEGDEIKEKLIVDVPLGVTDSEALLQICEDISKSIEFVVNWANEFADDLYRKASVTRPDPRLFDPGINGHEKRRMLRIKKGSGIKQSDRAKEFGLPTADSLSPFMYLLVKEHPKITHSFLVNLELYDKNGRLFGLEEANKSFYLIGYKMRKGGDRALQRIKLSEASHQRVKQIIKITEPVRSYLKSKGNDDWRFLFLSSGEAFHARRVPQQESNPRIHIKLAQQMVSVRSNFKIFKELFVGDVEALQNFSKALSIPKFRSTVGVKIYLDTKDAKKMAEALGHDAYKPELLSHYLPEPLLSFFQSRWIRIFQKGIICESMKDSPNLFEASRFHNTEELDEFLCNHSVRIPELDFQSIESTKEEILISINEDILTALLSLESAVVSAPKQGSVSEKAFYWSEFSKHLTFEIESNRYDQSIKDSLANAKVNRDPELMKNIIYG